MTRCRNDIVMVKRQTPKRVELPTSRVFYAKYKRVDKNLYQRIWKLEELIEEIQHKEEYLE